MSAASLAIPRHEAVDLELRQLAKRVETDFWAIVELCIEAQDGAYYARFGFVSLGDYLSERLRISYSSVMRRLRAVEAVRALPPEEHDRAREALTLVGATKAGIIAPIIQERPGEWQEWTERAIHETEEGLQAAVSVARGVKSRGHHEPGARFLRMVLNQMPPDAREEVARVFTSGERKHGLNNPIEVFLRMVQEVAVEWQH